MSLGTQFTKLTQPTPYVVNVQFNIASGAAAGTVVQGSFIVNPTQPNLTVTQLPVPYNEKWAIVDTYLTASPAVDGYFQFSLGLIQQPISYGPASQTLRSLFNKIKFTPILLPPNATLQMFYVTLAAASAAATIIANLNIVRLPVDYVGAVPVF